jgi:hypothetical protein
LNRASNRKSKYDDEVVREVQSFLKDDRTYYEGGAFDDDEADDRGQLFASIASELALDLPTQNFNDRTSHNFDEVSQVQSSCRFCRSIKNVAFAVNHACRFCQSLLALPLLPNTSLLIRSSVPDFTFSDSVAIFNATHPCLCYQTLTLYSYIPSLPLPYLALPYLPYLSLPS